MRRHRDHEQGPEATPADRIAETLRLQGPQTASEIAEAHGCGVVAVRSQLRNLEAAGLVTRTMERRPVGRPVSRYGLTERAEVLFPKKYDVFSTLITEAVVREFGPEGFSRILRRWEDDLHAHLDAMLPKDPGERLKAIATHQTKYGFMASVQRDENGVALVERNCPIMAIASRFPQICGHEAALLGRTLGWKTKLTACQAKGDATCVFQIGKAPKRDAGAPEGGREATTPGLQATKPGLQAPKPGVQAPKQNLQAPKRDA
jgi:predicted ArsR family transcriptional regulator